MHTSLTDMSQTCLILVCIGLQVYIRHVYEAQTCRKKTSYMYGATSREMSHTCLKQWHVMLMNIHVHLMTFQHDWQWLYSEWVSHSRPKRLYFTPFGRCPVISPNVKSPNANSPNVISSNINSPSYIHINIWCHIQWLYIRRRVHNRRDYIRRDDIRHLHSASGGSTLYMAFMRNN